MLNTQNTNQLKPHTPQSREVLQSKVRLVNSFSLIGLTLISVIALWLVSPSRSMLLTLLAESSSPDVALAFLYALDKSDPGDDSVKYLLFKNHIALNNLIKAEAIILTLIMKKNGEQNWLALEKYLQLLIIMHSVADKDSEKEDALVKIKSLFDKINFIPDANIARIFADSALSMGFAQKAYNYLLAHSSSSEITNHKELRDLALQFSDYDAALLHQQKIFDKYPNISQLKRLLRFYDNAKQTGKGYQFLKQYNLDVEHDLGRKNVPLSNEFIVLFIEQALLHNDHQYAKKLFKQITNSRLSENDLSSVVNASLANNNLELALIASQRQVSLYPTSINIKQAHKIAVWQGDIFKALELTHLIVVNNPSQSNIRQAITESIALGDFSSKGKYYNMLAIKGFLNHFEFNDYIKIIELTQGSRVAINAIDNLISHLKRSSTKDNILKNLLVHKARLYSYFSEYKALDDIWLEMNALTKEVRQSISIKETDLFSNAKINLGQPDKALKLFLTNENWLAQEVQYLQKIFSLAWTVGNKEIAIKVLDELVTRSDYDSSSILNAYRYVQLHQPFSESDIPRLVALADTWQNDSLLMTAIDLAYNHKNYAILDDLLTRIIQNPKYKDQEKFIFYAALSAIQQGKNEQVKELFAKLLKNRPKDDSIIKNYLWWLTDQNELELLASIYNRYKVELKNEMDFWLVFSAASQKLNNYPEAELWLRKLMVEENGINVNAILNYAQLMELKGEKELAFRLREYLVNNLSQELFELEPEHYTFIAMVKLFSGEQLALPMLENQVINKPDQRGTIELFSYYLQRQDYQRLFLLNEDQHLGHFKLPDWQELSIALLKKDKKTIEALVRKSLQLPLAQKNFAMQKLGGSANASWSDTWKQGEDKLGSVGNPIVEKELRQVHISQHPNKSHGFFMDYTNISFWDIERVTLQYYKPIKKGWWDVSFIEQRSVSPLLIQGSIIDNEVRGLFNLNLKIDWFEPYLEQVQPDLLNIKIDVADGLGSTRVGGLIGLTINIDDRLQGYYGLGINQAFEVSQFATLAAQNDQITFGLNYLITGRESLSLKLNLNDVSSRFGDKVASGWDYSMRLTEKLFFSDPGWELYLDFTHQEYSLEESPLELINESFSSNNRIEAIDFISKRFSRFAIGQRIFNGVTGQPGGVKSSPSYWLDASVGLNTINNRTDFSLSTGLGWRLFGDDELSLKLDWQSSDINGDESLKFSLSYYYNL